MQVQATGPWLGPLVSTCIVVPTPALQALHVMLDKELWQRLPLEESAEAPSLKAAVESTSREAAASAPAQEEADFEAWVAHGNPWARQTSGTPMHVSHHRLSRELVLPTWTTCPSSAAAFAL